MPDLRTLVSITKYCGAPAAVKNFCGGREPFGESVAGILFAQWATGEYTLGCVAF